MAYTVSPSSMGMHAGPLSGSARLEVGVCTDPGREPSKQINEDAAFARETVHGHLAVVCDGMGGHVGGREASHLAVETIFRAFDETPPGVPPPETLGRAIRAANHAVFTRGQSVPELAKMGSTCVAVLTHAGGSEVAHVGDSRVYLITGGQAYQVTKDHSLVQRLVDANMLTPEEASNHPNANQITNALGMRPDVDVEVRPQPFPLQAGDTFLLCSDGLSDELGPADFLHVLAPYPPLDVAARQLVDLANARGGHDNITVVLVRVPGGGPFSPPPVSGPGSTGVNTPIAFPVAGGVAPTATLEMPQITPEQAQAQAAYGAAGPTQTAPVAPAFVPPPPAPTPVYPSAPTPAEPARRGKTGLVVGVVLVLLLVAAGVLAALHFRAQQGEPSSGASSTESNDTPEAPTTTSTKPKAKPKPTATETAEPDEPEPTASAPSAPPPTKPRGGAAPPTRTAPTELAPSDTVKVPYPPVPTTPLTPSGDDTLKRAPH